MFDGGGEQNRQTGALLPSRRNRLKTIGALALTASLSIVASVDAGQVAPAISAEAQASGQAAADRLVRPGEKDLLLDQIDAVPIECQNNRPPVAIAGSDRTVTTRELVSFDGSLSFDEDGTLAPHAWNFNDDETAMGTSVTHTYPTAGTYAVTLTVTDDCGATSTDTILVTVTDPTVASANFSFGPNPAEIQQDVTFSAAAPQSLVLLYTWTFGDGKSGTGRTYTRKFTGGGTYSVTLKVYAKNGQLYTQSKTITVSAGLTLLSIVETDAVNLPRGFAVVNGAAWAAGDVQGLARAQVTGPGSPSLPVEATLPGSPWHVVASENLVAVASTWGGIYLFNPQAPNLAWLGRFDTYSRDGSYAYHLALHDGYLFAACSVDLKIIDVRNPANPILVNSWTGVGSLRTVDVIGDRAYVYDSNLGGIHVLDVSDPVWPQEVGLFLTEAEPEDFAFNDSLLVLAEGYGDVEIFDLSDPDQPELILQRTYTGDGVKGVELRGNSLYVAFGSRIEKLNVSNPAAPVLIQWVGLGRMVYELDKDADHLYAATAQGVGAVLLP